MNRSQSGKSILTANQTLLLYYICGLLTPIMGFTCLLAAVGALVSRSVAYKEGVPFVIKHCTWIFRSIWVGLILFGIIFCGALHLMGTEFLHIPDTSHIKSFEQLWTDPTLRLAVQYALAFICLGGTVMLWFTYRMLRGIYTLINALPPFTN